MRKYIVIALLLTGQIGIAQEVTTYYLIRHAEKERIDPSNRDPHLTIEGKERAENCKIYSRKSLSTLFIPLPIIAQEKLRSPPLVLNNLLLKVMIQGICTMLRLKKRMKERLF